jgi:hypothetical protein
MSLIFATQLTAVATTVLAVFAIVTGIYAVRAFRRQSQEVAILAEQNERAIHDRRKNQASRVFIWAEAQPSPYPESVPGLFAYIKNTSQQPVYDGFIGHRQGDQWIDGKERKPDLPAFAVLMPGEQMETSIGFANPVPTQQFWQDNSGLLTSLRFRDAAGVSWHYRSDGRLDDEPGEPPTTRKRRGPD